MTVLNCSDLVCSFEGVKALNKMTFKINKPGTCNSIIGPNSAGKTTLLNAICGLVSLKSGTVEINGRDVTSWTFEKRCSQLLIRSFEGGGVWDNLSVIDNLVGGIWEQPLHNARAQGEKILKKIGLSYARERRGSDLSIGERRKLELGRILLRIQFLGNDHLVLLDEPFRGLDLSAQDDLENMICEHFLGKVTILMVEHNREKALALSDKLFWLEQGSISDRIPPFAFKNKEKIVSYLDGNKESDSGNCLTLKEIQAGYNKVDILKGINFNCSFGEAVQIKGQNGSGKSTLFKVIAGSLAPKTGEMQLFGENCFPWEERVNKGLVVVHQGGRLVNQMTVQAHLDVAESVANRNGRNNCCLEKFFELFPVLKILKKQRVDELASGYRSLVALWVALATAPKVLLADEIGAALAPDIHEKIYKFLLDDWLDDKKGFVFIEHKKVLSSARVVSLIAGKVV